MQDADVPRFEPQPLTSSETRRRAPSVGGLSREARHGLALVRRRAWRVFFARLAEWLIFWPITLGPVLMAVWPLAPHFVWMANDLDGGNAVFVASVIATILWIWLMEGRLTKLSDFCNMERQRRGALALLAWPPSVRAQHVELLARVRRPDSLVLYLRSHGAETEQPWRVVRRSMHWTDGMSEACLEPRKLDATVFARLDIDTGSVVMLSNEVDATPPQGVLSIKIDRDHWFALVLDLIRRAGTIVVLTQGASSGLVRELRECAAADPERCRVFLTDERALHELVDAGIRVESFQLFMRTEESNWRLLHRPAHSPDAPQTLAKD